MLLENSIGTKIKNIREKQELSQNELVEKRTFDMSPTDHNGLNVDDLVMVEIVNDGWRIAK